MLLREGLLDGEDLPVELILVDEAKCSKDLQSWALEHGHLSWGQVDQIERIVVTHAARGIILEEAVLPCLGQASVVEISLNTIISQDKSSRTLWAFLKILNNRVEGGLCSYFHLCSGASGNLDDTLNNIEVGALRLESKVVPR